MNWEIQIDGDPADLRELSKSLAEDELRIVESNRQYFLESVYFRGLTRREEVISKAIEILQLLTGSVKLELHGRVPIVFAGVASIDDSGKKTLYVDVFDSLDIRDILELEMRPSDGTVVKFNPADDVKKWVRIGLSNHKVGKALSLFGIPEHDWVSLYRLYEVMEEDVGGTDKIARRGWATKTSIKLFKHTANSPASVGDASRHGSESTTPPPKPMSLTEARSLIEAIMHRWLSSKEI